MIARLRLRIVDFGMRIAVVRDCTFLHQIARFRRIASLLGMAYIFGLVVSIGPHGVVPLYLRVSERGFVRGS